MMTASRYFRFLMFADPKMGELSFSWRLKCCLEAAGHTVLWITPKLQPYAFARVGAIRAYMARALLKNQRPDFVILADGLLVDYPDSLAAAADGAPTGVLIEGQDDLTILLQHQAITAWQPDFAVVCGSGNSELLAEGGFQGRRYAVRPLPDAPFLATGLANTVAKARGILCLQDATPERYAALRALKDKAGSLPSPMRCYGKGWPDNWTASREETMPAYAVKRTHTVVVFDDGGDKPDERMLRTALAEGAHGILLGSEASESAWSQLLKCCPDADAFVSAGVVSTQTDADRAIAGLPIDRPQLECLLDDEIASVLDSLSADFNVEGWENPRTIVCVHGYLGKSNFANEHILSIIDERLRQRIPGATVVALSTNPRHTFEYRGIYAISIEDKHVLDKAVEASTALLSVAGLLVDQGVRWGMGKAEIFSNVTGCDVYSLAALAELSALNETDMVFYGVGAGPLELDDSRRLVRFMSALGASFIVRDEGSDAQIADCGVAADKRMIKADPAFLGACEQTSYVDNWLAKNDLDLSRDRLLAVTLRLEKGASSSYLRNIADAVDAAVRRDPSLKPVFCVMDSADVNAIDAIKPHLERPSEILIFRAWEDLHALGDFLSRAYAGLSMQYYSTLVMMRAEVPCMSVWHQPKEAALFSDIDCAELSMSADADAEQVADALRDVLERRDFWAERMACGSQKLVDLALEAEDFVVKKVLDRTQAKAYASEGEYYLYSQSVADREWEREEAKLVEAERSINAECNKIRRSRAKRSYRFGRLATFIPRKLGL